MLFRPSRLAIASSAVLLLLSGCNQSTEQTAAVPNDVKAASVSLQANADTGRWYSEAQVQTGRELYGQYCAACHGANAEATADWKTPTAEGNYPPPPLNGTAHAWHHPLSVLDMVIREGGEPVGGVMPAWGEVLTESQRLDIIASLQDYWPDDVYDIWLERERSNRE